MPVAASTGGVHPPFARRESQMLTSAAPSRVPPNHAATSPSFVSTIVEACALANGAVSNTNSDTMIAAVSCEGRASAADILQTTVAIRSTSTRRTPEAYRMLRVSFQTARATRTSTLSESHQQRLDAHHHSDNARGKQGPTKKGH